MLDGDPGVVHCSCIGQVDDFRNVFINKYK